MFILKVKDKDRYVSSIDYFNLSFTPHITDARVIYEKHHAFEYKESVEESLGVNLELMQVKLEKVEIEE